jgi:hypothetical protein
VGSRRGRADPVKARGRCGPPGRPSPADPRTAQTSINQAPWWIASAVSGPSAEVGEPRASARVSQLGRARQAGDPGASRRPQATAGSAIAAESHRVFAAGRDRRSGSPVAAPPTSRCHWEPPGNGPGRCQVLKNVASRTVRSDAAYRAVRSAEIGLPVLIHQIRRKKIPAARWYHHAGPPLRKADGKFGRQGTGCPGVGVSQR